MAGGIDPTDKRAEKYGLPPIDSMNMWSFLMGKNGFDISDRNDVFLSSGDDGGLIMKTNGSTYKILFGKQSPAFWTTLDYPNGTQGEPQSINCGSVENGGCLFDIIDDPTEHKDLFKETKYKQLISEMRQKFLEMNATRFNPDRGEVDMRCCAQIGVNDGYWGPWLNETRNEL